MLRRKIDSILQEWKKNKDKKSLLVRGARQVGKTTTIRHLGESYSSFIEINFLKNPSLKAIFSGDLDTDTLLLNFSVYLPEASFIPNETLLFLDEIQECPEAITSLKFFVEDKRFDVISSGSMLGIDYKRPSSYPVGSVEYIDMYSLSFEEFVWAKGISEDVVGRLKGYFEASEGIPDALNDKMLSLLRLYMVVGGMPEAVKAYIDNNSVSACYEVQRRILNDYRYDIAHYASSDIKIKAEKCYFSLCDQLTKPNHKFQYSILEKGSNQRKFGSSIDWLIGADLVVQCKNVSRMEIPLMNYSDDGNFRLYATDIGLLTAMYDYGIKTSLLSDDFDKANGYIRGGLYEALIAELLYKNGHNALYFRKNEQATFELEFLLEAEGGVVPVEVKAKNSRSRSLDNALKRKEIPYGYKLIGGNTGRSGKKITLPLYMAMFL